MALGAIPRLMGIVNVTPDSFSDGGKFFSPESAVHHALNLAAEGADILDIGGQSTRPYAEFVSCEEELRRVIPVVEQLANCCPVPLSIDTFHAQVAREALAAGAEIVNDISGLSADPHMLAVIAETGAGVCAMHMQGTPQTMQDNPTYRDVAADIYAYLQQVRDRLQSHGISRDRMALDPGIGFGKTHQHNLDLLAAAGQFHALGCPLLLGPSRKGFIAKVIGDKSADRLAGTTGVVLALARAGVQIIRVHEIAPIRQALQLFGAVGGIEPAALRLERG
jgi:dihydropteroate synthase